MGNNKVFSGIDRLPCGEAPDTIKKGCIVLEGGAFRGVYGEGVLDAFMEAGYNFSCTVGVSAGAMNGVTYVSGQIGQSARINLRYRHDSRYISWRNYPRKEGIIDFDFVFKHLPDEKLDVDRLNRTDRQLYVVATNCLTGEPMFFEKSSCSDIFRCVRASASMPYVSKMVDIDGTPYLDGGCSDKIPYRWAMEQGYEKIITVRTRPASWRYERKKESRMPYRFYHAYPEFAKVLAGSDRRYNEDCDALEDLVKEGRIYSVSPSRYLPVGRLEKDMEKPGELYYLGYEDGKNALPGLKAYMEA